MKSRTIDEYKQEFKHLMGESRSSGWIFGVCATIAKRSGWELWIVRTCAAILLLTTTLYAALAYFVLAMLFSETRPGAQKKMTRWARQADDLLEILVKGIKGIVSQSRRSQYRSADYQPEKSAVDEEIPRKAA